MVGPQFGCFLNEPARKHPTPPGRPPGFAQSARAKIHKIHHGKEPPASYLLQNQLDKHRAPVESIINTSEWMPFLSAEK
jgi:hypothetical protein